jgi:hypothetical protein
VDKPIEIIHYASWNENNINKVPYDDLEKVNKSLKYGSKWDKLKKLVDNELRLRKVEDARIKNLSTKISNKLGRVGKGYKAGKDFGKYRSPVKESINERLENLIVK